MAMDIHLKEVEKIVRNDKRKKWQADPRIKTYFKAGSSESAEQLNEQNVRYFEIYYRKSLVGDIKVFMTTEDQDHNRAQVMILVGEPIAPGIGTRAIELLAQQLKNSYHSIYCLVNRYNIASIKILKKNLFKIKDFLGTDVLLVRKLN